MAYHSLSVTRTAHYCQLGEPGPHIRQFWLVCHGYGQLADEFIEDFRQLENASALIVAPEGPNYFYKKGFDGPVGATWMTRLHRESQIEDYVELLHTLYRHFAGQLPADVRIVLLGFSQGTATICRFALHRQPHFHDLVLWGGLPPEDVDYGARREFLADKKLYLLYGTHDPFLTSERLASLQAIEDRSGVDFDETSYEGGHEITPEALQTLRKQIKQ